MGFSGIYFIWNGRRVKIGMSICIRSRMTTMQIENDETLKLIGFIPSPDYNFMGWLENKYTKWDDEYFKKNAYPKRNDLKINNDFPSLKNEYDRVWHRKFLDEEQKHQKYFEEYQFKKEAKKHQWFDITVDEARKYIYQNKGVLPEKFTNDNNGWKDNGDFFVVRNMRDD